MPDKSYEHTGFGLAQIKKEGHCYCEDPSDPSKFYGLINHNNKITIRNYGRELKNGKGMTISEAVRIINDKYDKDHAKVVEEITNA